MKVVLLSALVIISFGGIVVFSACNKTSCSNMICENGGTCSGGKCTCPTGYSGPFCNIKATTAIVYTNNTFTPISIGINGGSATIPVGGRAVFTGQVGSVASGTATTSGSASQFGISSSGGVLGLQINWQLADSFPSGDTLRKTLDVGSTYFFLRMKNTGSADVIDFYVNYGFSYGSVYQDATIPHDGKTYDLGYYLAYPSSNVQTQSSTSQVVWKPVNLPVPFTSNQSYTVNIP